jgi:hypothetical protein
MVEPDINNKPPKRGRHPIINNPDELDVAINAYFKSLEGYRYDSKGNILKDLEGNPVIEQFFHPPTMAGLGLALGISRMTLIRYAEKDPIMCASVSRARQRIEQYAESRLYDRDGNQGAKFSLSNNHEGWQDQSTAAPASGTMPIEDCAKLLLGMAQALTVSKQIEKNVTPQQPQIE